MKKVVKFSSTVKRGKGHLSPVFIHIKEIIFLFLNIKDEPLENRDY